MRAAFQRKGFKTERRQVLPEPAFTRFSQTNIGSYIMKKLLSHLFSLVLVLVLLTAAGCSSSNVTGEALAGEYDLVSMHEPAAEGKEPETWYAADQGITGVLTLKEDGTGVYEFMYQTIELTYDTDKKTISYDGYEDPFTYKDGVLEWTMGENVHSFQKR